MSPLWTIEEVAAYLKVPVNTIYQWRTKQYGPRAKKCGRYLRYEPDDVIRWVRDDKEGSDA